VEWGLAAVARCQRVHRRSSGRPDMPGGFKCKCYLMDGAIPSGKMRDYLSLGPSGKDFPMIPPNNGRKIPRIDDDPVATAPPSPRTRAGGPDRRRRAWNMAGGAGGGTDARRGTVRVQTANQRPAVAGIVALSNP